MIIKNIQLPNKTKATYNLNSACNLLKNYAEKFLIQLQQYGINITTMVDRSIKDTVLIEITAIDNNTEQQRFDIIYSFLDIKKSIRSNIKIKTNGIQPCTTINKIFKNATWLEREVFDMFGLFFKRNTDMRRILTDYGFDGYPLRKEFPIFGKNERSYDLDIMYIVNTKAIQNQELRFEERFFKETTKAMGCDRNINTQRFSQTRDDIAYKKNSDNCTRQISTHIKQLFTESPNVVFIEVAEEVHEKIKALDMNMRMRRQLISCNQKYLRALLGTLKKLKQNITAKKNNKKNRK